MKISCLISGGVDSSVALALLKEQGYDVTAFYLKIWLEDEVASLGSCPWEEDLDYAQRTCNQLGVPLEVVSMQREYWDHVVAYTISEVEAGRTPNPDVMCNEKVKFGFFANHIDKAFDKIATGHYAKVEETDAGIILKTAPDPIKDQTYFLSHLSQKQLERAMFPIGHMPKSQVRDEAARFKLPTAKRKDSQGICFLGKINFDDFLRHHLGEKPGDIVEFETEKKIGTHNGFWFHTIGQRKGLGLSGGPWYVVDKDPQKNIVFISSDYHSVDKKRRDFAVADMNWIGRLPKDLSGITVKLRHGPQSHGCSIEILETGDVKVELDSDDHGIAPGQFAVFYQGDRCLGGGAIKSPSC